MNSIFVPISVEDRLPTLTEYDGLCSKTVVVIINEKSYRAPGKSWGDPAGEYIKQVYYSAYYTKDGWIWEYGDQMDDESISNMTHWLEEDIASAPNHSRVGEAKEEIECSTDNPCSYCRSLDETADGKMNPIALEQLEEQLLDKTIMLEAAEQTLEQTKDLALKWFKEKSKADDMQRLLEHIVNYLPDGNDMKPSMINILAKYSK